MIAHRAETKSVAAPPTTIAGTRPNSAAVTPDSNSPSSFEDRRHPSAHHIRSIALDQCLADHHAEDVRRAEQPEHGEREVDVGGQSKDDRFRDESLRLAAPMRTATRDVSHTSKPVWALTSRMCRRRRHRNLRFEEGRRMPPYRRISADLLVHLGLPALHPTVTRMKANSRPIAVTGIRRHE